MEESRFLSALFTLTYSISTLHATVEMNKGLDDNVPPVFREKNGKINLLTPMEYSKERNRALAGKHIPEVTPTILSASNRLGEE